MRDTSNACIQSWQHGSVIIQSNIQSVFNDPAKAVDMQQKIMKQLSLPLEFKAY